MDRARQRETHRAPPTPATQTQILFRTFIISDSGKVPIQDTNPHLLADGGSLHALANDAEGVGRVESVVRLASCL